MMEREGTLASAAYLIRVNNVKNYNAKGDKRLERANFFRSRARVFGYGSMHRT